MIFTVRCLGSSFPSLQPGGDAFSLNNQISEEHHRQRCMMFSVLINDKEKGNVLLLIFCVNLRTQSYPAAVRIRLGISSASGCKSNPFHSKGKEFAAKETGGRLHPGHSWTGRAAQGQSSPSSRFSHPLPLIPGDSHRGSGLDGAVCSAGRRAQTEHVGTEGQVTWTAVVRWTQPASAIQLWKFKPKRSEYSRIDTSSHVQCYMWVSHLNKEGCFHFEK